MTTREINEAVARKLGFDHRAGIFDKDGYTVIADEEPIPDYCTSIAAAWEVVEWMQKHMPEEILRLECVGNDWEFGPTMISGDEEFIADGTNGRADTAPMAICLAYLKLGDNVR